MTHPKKTHPIHILAMAGQAIRLATFKHKVTIAMRDTQSLDVLIEAIQNLSTTATLDPSGRKFQTLHGSIELYVMTGKLR